MSSFHLQLSPIYCLLLRILRNPQGRPKNDGESENLAAAGRTEQMPASYVDFKIDFRHSNLQLIRVLGASEDGASLVEDEVTRAKMIRKVSCWRRSRLIRL